MADLTLETPATLFRSNADTIAMISEQSGIMVKEGRLGELITHVINGGAAEHWRYVIVTDDGSLLRAPSILVCAQRLGIKAE